MLPRGFGLWNCLDQTLALAAWRHALFSRNKSKQRLSTSVHKLNSAQADAIADGQAADSDDSRAKTGIDIERVFMRNDVQNLLQRTTKANANVIYARPRRRLLGVYPTNIEESKIKALTNEELQALTEKHARKMEERLQIPPIMKEREPCEKLIKADDLLASYDSHKHVFVDITYGTNPRKRGMVIRETDGKLRTAGWNERDRLLQIYFPLEGRSVDVPKLFEPENLRAALNQQKYRMVLDRACLQFEPDSLEYIRVCQQAYDSIDDRAAYAELHSTRHNAGFLFYLAVHQRIDKYLNWCLRQQLLQASIQIVQLLELVHNNDEQLRIDDEPTRAQNDQKLPEYGSPDEVDDIDIATGTKIIENYLQETSIADEADRVSAISVLRRLTNNEQANVQKN